MKPSVILWPMLALATAVWAQPEAPADATQSQIEAAAKAGRKRARQLGVQVGVLEPTENNAITDVAGVKVGHATLIRGESVRTGVTVVLPHGGNLFQEKVPAAVYCYNSFGKLAGSTQIEELGEIETPIALTNTLSVGAVVAALVRHTLNQPGNESVRSVNAVVGETNDGYLNDIRGMHVTEADVRRALAAAASGPVPEGAVGAGTGVRAFGFKGGVGTAARQVPFPAGKSFAVGALAQVNYGWILDLDGAPVTRALRQPRELDEAMRGEDGSCMMVIATDAPLSPRNLKRLAKRAVNGMIRTRAVASNGSGDYAIAFSTAYRLQKKDGLVALPPLVANDAMTPLFHAVDEAVEEAVYNALFMAVDMTGFEGRRLRAIPLEETIAILEKHRLKNLRETLQWRPYQR